MTWVNINRIEESKFKDNDSKIVYFDFLGREKFAIVSRQVLNYLGVNYSQFQNAKRLFVIKSFNKFDKVIYMIKKVET